MHVMNNNTAKAKANEPEKSLQWHLLQAVAECIQL